MTFQFEERKSPCKGIKFYKKGDHSVSLFVPSAGLAYDGRLRLVGIDGVFLASSRFSEAENAFNCAFYSGVGRGGVYAGERYFGFSVRGIMRKLE